jgi:hypothetical protein
MDWVKTEIQGGMEEFEQWFDSVLNQSHALWGDLAAAASDKSTSVLPAVRGFVAAVDWGEPLLLALGAFHFTAAAVCVFAAVRGSETTLFVVFCVIGLMVLAVRPLNSLLADHWEAIATQPYFDPHGVFACAVLAAPLLALELALVVVMLLRNCRMLRRAAVARAKASRIRPAAAKEPLAKKED